ncbi:IS66 family insertion sequence element accessory protein TnpA [Paenibacillus puerhi]|uniref:IS66 family insertion sequence element accessory protein TnpA n=1 Tax=Paenibacillus puerhi TaxID=2692622 RepID=UPI00135BEBBD|nr:IS66 family insertion sequence element accessory protein TnpB [Paenibacillus puerhi]
MSNKEQRRKEWSGRIAAYKASGRTMATWCAANGCTMDQLKYWLRKTKKNPLPAEAPVYSPRFVPLTVIGQPEAPSSLVVRVGQASIELQSGFDPGLLRSIVLALETPC